MNKRYLILILSLIILICILFFTFNHRDSEKQIDKENYNCSENLPVLFTYIGDYEYNPYPEEEYILKRRAVKVDRELLINKTSPININLFDGECYAVESIKYEVFPSNISTWWGREVGQNYTAFSFTIDLNSEKILYFHAENLAGYSYLIRKSNETPFMIQFDPLKLPPLLM